MFTVVYDQVLNPHKSHGMLPRERGRIFKQKSRDDHRDE